MTSEIEKINKEEKEIWKINPNYPDYEISSFGNIKNINTGQLFKFDIEKFKNCDTYIKKRLTVKKEKNDSDTNESKNTNRDNIYIHRLVALTFIENSDPINKTTVNHKDGDRYNNKASNLEWASHKEQSEHSVKHNLKSSTSKGRSVKIYKNGKEYKSYKSLSDAYRDINPTLKVQICDTQFRKLFSKNKKFKDKDDNEISGKYNDICEDEIKDDEIEKWKN